MCKNLKRAFFVLSAEVVVKLKDPKSAEEKDLTEPKQIDSSLVLNLICHGNEKDCKAF